MPSSLFIMFRKSNTSNLNDPENFDVATSNFFDVSKLRVYDKMYVYERCLTVTVIMILRILM